MWVILFGWIFPLLLVGIWYVINLLEDVNCKHKSAWQYVYMVPIYVLLMANLIMLICILRVLFIKLRNSNEQRQQQLRMRQRRNSDAVVRNRDDDDDDDGSKLEDQKRSPSPDDLKSDHFTLR